MKYIPLITDEHGYISLEGSTDSGVITHLISIDGTVHVAVEKQEDDGYLYNPEESDSYMDLVEVYKQFNY